MTMLVLPFMIALLLPQPSPIALDLKESALLDAIDLVAQKGGITITFSTDVLAMSPSLPHVSVQAVDATPLEILDVLLAETGLTREDAAGSIVIVRLPSPGPVALASPSRSAAVPQTSVANAIAVDSGERAPAATTSRQTGPSLVLIEPSELQLRAAPAMDTGVSASAVSANPPRADATVIAVAPSPPQPVRVRVVLHKRLLE